MEEVKVSTLKVGEYTVYPDKVMGKGLLFPFVEAEKDGHRYLAHCIKCSHLTKEHCECIKNEASWLRLFDFPHIIKRAGTAIMDSNYLLILYEYCKLGSVASYIKGKSLSVDKVKEILHQVLKALCVFQTYKMSVLALSPESVFVHQEGSGELKYVVADLMLSTKWDEVPKRFNDYMYLSHEVAQGKVDAKTDLFSLGVFAAALRKNASFGEDAHYFEKFVVDCISKEEKENLNLGRLLLHPFMNRKGKLEREYDIKESDLKGSGGFGQVYKTTKKGQDTVIAIKKLHPYLQLSYEEMREKILAAREIRTMYAVYSTACGRRYCTQIIDHFRNDDTLCLVMEYCSGGTLYDRIKAGLEPHLAPEIMKQIATGLLGLHSANIIHRDIKPRNILFKDTSCDTIKLCDFGLIKQIVSSTDNLVSIDPGYFDYIPHEVGYSLQQTTAIDIWSCGIILFEMIYGKHPKEYVKNNIYGLRSGNVKVVFPSYIGEIFPKEAASRLIDLITWCLKKEPKRRPTAKEIIEFIDTHLSNYLIN